MEYLSGIDLLTNNKAGGMSGIVDDGAPRYQTLRISANPHQSTVTRTSSVCSIDKNVFALDDADSVDDMIALTNMGAGGGGFAKTEVSAPSSATNVADHDAPDSGSGSGSGSDCDSGSGEGSDDGTGSGGDDDASDAVSDASSDDVDSSVVARPRRRDESGWRTGGERRESSEDLAHKKQLIYRLDRMSQRGMHMPKRYTMKDPLEEIQAEYDRLKQNRDMDASIRFQRRMLVACVTGIEFLNSKFDPFDVRLNGWSDSINENIDDYDDVFEELFLKYRGKAKMAPELNLMMMVGGSGLMFHLTNSMFRSSNMPDLGEVMKRNPELMRQFTNATLETMHSTGGRAPPPQPAGRMRGGGGGGGGGGGLMGVIGSMFGMGGGLGGGGGPRVTVTHSQPAVSHSPQPAAPQQSFMRGPKNVDEILRDLQNASFSASMQPGGHAPPPPAPQPQLQMPHQRPASPTFSVGDSDVLESIAAPSAPAPKKRAPRANAKKAVAPRRSIDI
jgi:hypothetical protein